MDVGCAVGGSTFELSRAFTDCLGIDYSHGFIEAAQVRLVSCVQVATGSHEFRVVCVYVFACMYGRDHICNSL